METISPALYPIGEELVPAALFLAANDAAEMIGNYLVDGGYNLIGAVEQSVLNVSFPNREVTSRTAPPPSDACPARSGHSDCRRGSPRRSGS